MTLPNFLVIGSPKCATTAICKHLQNHPEVCFSKPKEPFFFCWDKNYNLGEDWYRSCFSHANGEPAIGEGTTHYALVGNYPVVIDRIQSLLNTPKIIFCVRHPYERMQSEWVELRSQGLTTRSFSDDIRLNSWYIDGSMYGRTFEAYASAFGLDNIHCVFYDDFKRDAAGEMARIFSFLKVVANFEPPKIGKKIYSSDGKREDWPLVNFARHNIPGFYTLRDAAPKNLRNTMKKILKKPIDGYPNWDRESRAWVSDQIAADVHAFLRRLSREELVADWLGGAG